MKKPKTDVLTFNFQEIDITEIPKLIPTFYRSKYAELQAQIIERVNRLKTDKSFVFAPNGKIQMTDGRIAGICHGVNTSLKKQNLPWRIRYSEKAKVFVVMPLKVSQASVRTVHDVAAPENVPAAGFKEETATRLNQLVHLLQKKFNVTVREMQQKNASDEIQDLKRAALYVGRNGLGLKLSQMGKLFDIASASYLTALCQQAVTNPKAKEKVAVLAAALNNS